MYMYKHTQLLMHSVYTNAMLSVQSSELGPHPLIRKRVLPPPLGSRGETHSLAGEGVGGPNSDEGTDTLVLYVYNPSTHPPFM